MRVPLSWLNEYIKVDDIEPKELAEKLTRAGLQVEAIETIGGSPLSDLIVVAEVLSCEAHPNSDHLHVCQVTDGTETYQVVCGAPNMRKGIKTAFAKIGAPIPGFLDKNGNPEKIKKGKLRGVESFGMCCSEKELCIGEGNSGIIEYPADTLNGALVRDVAKLEKPEVVFDIEVTWNRPDALSVRGIAREYSAILSRPLKQPTVDFVESDVDVNDEISVRVEDIEKCPRYTARVVTSVQDVPSPEFMRKRLELCGVRSMGLLVDVTNYVMLELGQPMHAFDYRELKDRTVVVRNAVSGETMRTLDGVERKLDPTMLVICDAEKPNCIAGVMGGEESKVKDQTAAAGSGTTSVLLESALFDCANIKFTATKLGLSSESSYRYVRGVDINLADTASRRAAHLLQKYGNAIVAKGVVDVDNRKKYTAADGSIWYHPDVTFNFERARRLIGIPIGNEAMVHILRCLGVTPREGKDLRSYAAMPIVSFGIPSWRRDLTLEADLVEEIARIYGLDNIPDTMPSAPSVSPLSDQAFRAKCRVRELCTALGFSEAMHYSFLSKKELDDFDLRNAPARLVIPDPVSAEYGVMRDSLLPQMMGSLGRNASHQLETAMLFEIGKVFSLSGTTPTEQERLSLGMVGPVGREPLRTRVAVTEEDAALWMKGVVEELVAKLHAGHLEFVPADHPAFVPGASLSVKLNGRAIGVLGVLSARLRHPYRLTTQMALCELDLKPLLKKTNDLGRVSPVPQFPLVRRDIAVVADKSIPNATIEGVIRKNGGKELVKVSLFDVFKNSRAYALEFRSSERTLTDDEVGAAFQKIVAALRATAGIEVREG